MVFVDDFVFGFFSETAALQASLVLMMMSFLNVPLSWNKLELGTNITWIGWNIDTISDTVAVTQEKIDKLIRKLKNFSNSGKFLRKDVEKLAGTLLWISEMFPHIRWMLGILYTVLSRTGLQLVRLNKQQVHFILQNIDEPRNTDSFSGSTICSTRSNITEIGQNSGFSYGPLCVQRCMF